MDYALGERLRATSSVDTVDGRQGEWMHTSLGGRFWPLDPRPEDIHVSDIANGHALDCRYNGQGRVSRFYSVAEHTELGADFLYRTYNDPMLALAFLFHDAAEGLLKDLSRAVKHGIDSIGVAWSDTAGGLEYEIGPANAYSVIEKRVHEVILRKYGLWDVSVKHKALIKDIDCRLVPLEKAAIMKYPQPWAYDKFAPLPGVIIQCRAPMQAKAKWAEAYQRYTIATGRHPEPIELD